MFSLACTSIHKECVAQGIWQLKFQPWFMESKRALSFLLQSLSLDLLKTLPEDEVWVGILLSFRKFRGNQSRICNFLLSPCFIRCSPKALDLGMWKGTSVNSFQSSPHLP